MTMALSFLEGRNWLMGAVFFQRSFAVLVCFRCKQEGTVSINNLWDPLKSYHQLYILRWTTWTQRQLSDYNHSPFLYNIQCTLTVQCTLYIVQSVKVAYNNGIRCKGLQSLLSNLGLTALSQVSFQKITKFLSTDAIEVIIIII